jgi:hypothetical protein
MSNISTTQGAFQRIQNVASIREIFGDCPISTNKIDIVEVNLNNTFLFGTRKLRHAMLKFKSLYLAKTV